jgi:DNA-binding LacI/PurR family transcriptional regulator
LLGVKKGAEAMELALAVRPAREEGNPMETPLVSAGPHNQPPTVSIREVAKRAKVSPATVSLVINENSRISPATQKRVRKIMEQLGYRPNRLAQSLSSRYTRALAVMLPSMTHAFADRYFGELISGICDRARKLKYKVVLEQVTPEFIAEREHLDLFERRFVDGVLCLGNSDQHSFITDFGAGKHPMIVVNNYFPQWDLDYIVCDYRAGAEQAMNYLLQLNHRRIGMLAGSSRVQTARDVVDVYEQKLKEAGIKPVAGWRQDGLFTEAGGAKATEKLLAEHPDITAILAGNDKMAIGALHYLHGIGKHVPGDISIVGFDDMQEAEFIDPTLTTVRLPLYQVGVLACEKLFERIQGGGERVRTVLATHLVVRQSSGIARN